MHEFHGQKMKLKISTFKIMKVQRSHFTHSNLPRSRNYIITRNLPLKLSYLTNIDWPSMVKIFPK